MARSAAYVQEAPAHTPPDLDPATLGLRPASFRGNHFPPKPSQKEGFLSKTSSATTAPCSWINKPASGALHAPTEPPFPAQNTWMAPRSPERSSLSPPLPEELDSSPPQASGEAGWIQPQTCSNHTLLLPARGPPPGARRGHKQGLKAHTVENI